MTKYNLLIFIPTYNERDNIGAIYQKIKDLHLEAHFLFLDDNSPDGTGEVIDRLARENATVFTVHRAGKMGIGSAHLSGIRWAYDHGYRTLVTLDCDFTHQPEDIRRFLECAPETDVVVGSRYMNRKSLADWNLLRRFLTHLGHFLTKHLLGMPYDASGAFRLYRLDKIPSGVFSLVKSKSYSFFFESLHILALNHFRIQEIPILLPKRTYGHSKMKLKDITASLRLLISSSWHTLFYLDDYLYSEKAAEVAGRIKSADEKAWDEYWQKKEGKGKALYDLIAVFYRTFIIKPMLNRYMRREFVERADVLHAGCGGGQVDTDVVRRVRVTALDISTEALYRYKKLHGNTSRVLQGSIFAIPSESGAFDGIYNLGVMEHFSEDEIKKILNEFYRVLKPEGKMVLFWPPEYGSSVTFLKGVHFILNDLLKKNIQLHPDEITRIQSKSHVTGLLEKCGFTLKQYSFGLEDFFTYVIVIAKKNDQDIPAAALPGQR